MHERTAPFTVSLAVTVVGGAAIKTAFCTDLSYLAVISVENLLLRFSATDGTLWEDGTAICSSLRCLNRPFPATMDHLQEAYGSNL